MYMKSQKFFLIAALVVVVAVVVAAFSFRRDTDLSGSLPAEMVNKDNHPIAFADLKGKVLFVNNWASWCPPCIAEMPSIMELKRKLEGVDIEFVMVSFDEDRSKAEAFINKRKYDFNIYFPGKKYPFVTSSIPATFIVDKTGKTVMEHTGMTDYSSDEIVNQLKALANE
jgi:thiol-disulfide isomerase/thioredoxin